MYGSMSSTEQPVIMGQHVQTCLPDQKHLGLITMTSETSTTTVTTMELT